MVHVHKTPSKVIDVSSQVIGRFSKRLNEQDFLNVTVWPGKSDPNADVIVVEIRHREGDEWETVGRLAVYRSSDGRYVELPERPPPSRPRDRGDVLQV